jgi:hypothetical protein
MKTYKATCPRCRSELRAPWSAAPQTIACGVCTHEFETVRSTPVAAPAPKMLVPISHGSVVIGNTAYPLHNVTSVSLNRIPGDKSAPTVILVLGSIALLLSLISFAAFASRVTVGALIVSLLFAAFGAGFVWMSVRLYHQAKDSFVVTVTTTAGQQVSFNTKDAESAKLTAGEIVRQTKATPPQSVRVPSTLAA